MAQIGDRLPLRIHLMKHVVPEQFQEIALRCLGPIRIMIKPGVIVYLEIDGGF
jgi:hypothetical protein